MVVWCCYCRGFVLSVSSAVAVCSCRCFMSLFIGVVFCCLLFDGVLFGVGMFVLVVVVCRCVCSLFSFVVV